MRTLIPSVSALRLFRSGQLSMLLAIIFAFSVILPSWGAETPSVTLTSYYADIDGKSTNSTDDLRKTLCTIISTGYVTIGYSSLPNSVYAASSNPSDFYNGSSKTMEDIYSSYPYTASQAGASATNCGQGWNKEHTVPQSWFEKASPMVSDAHHIFPTDIKMNSLRSSYPYGENSAAKECSNYGYGHLGTSTFSGYTGQVYEPDDNYKGDLARVYFYMVTRYRTTNFTSGSGNTSFTYTGGVADLTPYIKNLMLKWHRQDPVSEKELKRNNAIYAHQKNRNPFVDYPCLVEYIWGEHKGEAVDLSSLISGYDGTGTDCCSGASTDPTIVSPSGTVNVGSTSAGDPVSKSVTVKGTNLTGGLSFSISGTNAALFSLSTTTMSQTNATNGTAITITYTPTSAGSHTATLTISGGGLASAHTVTLTGTCCSSYEVTLMRNGAAETISSCGEYTLPTSSTESDACDGWTFRGWITSSSYSSTTAPSYVTEVSSAATLYAVYGKTEGGGGSGSETLSCTAGTISGEKMSFNTTNFTIVHAKGTSDNFASYSPWRVYTNNTVTISGSYPITSVVITCGSDDYATKAAASTLTPSGGGTVSASASSNTCTITATGTVTSLVISPSAQTRWSSIEINYSGGGTTTYKTAPCTTYTITLAGGGTASHGTFSASATSATAGSTIILDANPEDGYELSSWTVTKAGGGTVSVSSDQFTMPAANVTVSATFSALPTYTATFINNGATHATFSTYEGGTITTPTDPTPCDGYTFVGWSTNTYAVDNTSAPDVDYTGVMPAANTTYYAVFSKTEGSVPTPTNNYTRITSADDLTSGSNYVIAAYYSSKYYALNTTVGGGGSSAAYLGTTVVTPSADVITTTDATIVWQITKSGSYLRFYNADAGKYLYTYTSGGGYGGTKYNLGLTTGTTGVDYSYTFNTGEWTLKSRSYSSYYVEQYSGKYQMYTSNGNPISIYKQVYEGGSITYYTTSPSCVVPLTGDMLDIVDWTATSLTINATGFASSGWPYTINSTSYASGDREADRTLIIPHSTAADGTLRIEVTNSASTVVSRQDYTVPHVYESSATLSGTTSSSIVVVRGGTLTINTNTTLAALYIAPDAELVVNGGKTLTVGKLVLRTTPWKAAVLTNNGTINATNTYYTRIIADKTQFYWFALPLASNTANVTLSDGSSCAVASTTSPYGKAWILRYYDTASRAANGIGVEGTSTNWVNLGASGSTYSDAAIEASRGYELFSNSNYYREYYFPVTLPTSATSVSVTYATGAAGAAHAGWNILCSPYTHTHSIVISDPATAIKICQLQEDGSYLQTQPTSLAPVIPFAYQASANGSLNFGTNSFTFSAPQRLTADEETETEWLQLALYQSETKHDETSLYAHPTRFSADYEIGVDVAKQSLTASRALLYSTHAYGAMAFAGVSDETLRQGVALGIYSPAAQQLRIALQPNDFLSRLAHVYLTDTEIGQQTDLLTSDYTFSAEQGTTDGRLLIRGVFAGQENTTDLGEIESTDRVTVYDALGHLLYAGEKRHALTGLTAGVYIVRMGDQAQRIVVNP